MPNRNQTEAVVEPACGPDDDVLPSLEKVGSDIVESPPHKTESHHEIASRHVSIPVKVEETMLHVEPSRLAESIEPQSENGLPPGWIEQEDPGTGNVYYFHALTNESTWERPTVGAASFAIGPVGSAVVDESSAMPNRNQTEAVVEPACGPDDDVLPSLESVGSDIVESPPHQTESHHEIESRHVSIPVKVEDPVLQVEPSRPAESIEPQSENGLPPGWIEQEDPGTGNVYYFHALTNESTWERPTVGAASFAIGPVGSAVVDESSAMPNRNQTEAVVEPACGPDDDVLPSLESVGSDIAESPPHKTESHHEIESRHVSIPVKVEETMLHVEPSRPAESIEPQSENGLPPGWIEQEDPGTGNAYYFHALTNESTWERRTVGAASFAIGAVGSAVVDEPPVKPNRDQSEAEVGPACRPDDDVIEASSHKAELHTEATIPEGWIQLQDSATGAVYYYNESTQETTWERPATSISPSTVFEKKAETGNICSIQLNRQIELNLHPHLPVTLILS
jgi:hypothetical protein